MNSNLADAKVVDRVWYCYIIIRIVHVHQSAE